MSNSPVTSVAAQLNNLIEESCLTVFPSHAYETLGKSILESYAHERPVVATDLGSRRELVIKGETGVLYPVGDVGATGNFDCFPSRPAQADASHGRGRP